MKDFPNDATLVDLYFLSSLLRVPALGVYLVLPLLWRRFYDANAPRRHVEKRCTIDYSRRLKTDFLVCSIFAAAFP